MTKRLRLLKVIVQPVFIIDDGETLVEQVAQPIAVPAADWSDYPTGAFARQVEQLRTEIEMDSLPDGD